jgi:hypothetical protein
VDDAVAEPRQSDILEDSIAALNKDFARLGTRIRTLEHEISCACRRTKIRLHYPALRDGQPTMHELVRLLLLYLTSFALPREQLNKINENYGRIPVDQYNLLIAQLSETARTLFKRAQRATNRNGEAGELLLYLLTEWVLGAPQLLAKMSLKTNPEMAVHGADGIHVRYDASKKQLVLYWGEAKLYSDISTALAAAAKSISTALQEENIAHELQLVERFISLSGIEDAARPALLSYLDPFDERSNERINVATCLIGFDFEAFQKLNGVEAAKSENLFCELAKAKLGEIAPRIAENLRSNALQDRAIELFLFPVPSIQQFRDSFQDQIGWNS